MVLAGVYDDDRIFSGDQCRFSLHNRIHNVNMMCARSRRPDTHQSWSGAGVPAESPAGMLTRWYCDTGRLRPGDDVDPHFLTLSE